MNKRILIYLLIASTFIACEANNKRKLVAAHKTHIQKKKISKVAVDTDSTKILMSKTYLHSFSDQFKLDTFKLILTGKSVMEGKLTFQITNFDGNKIYTDKFTAYDLLGDIDDTSSTQQQKLDTFKVRFNNFFGNRAFSIPAINPEEPLDSDYVDVKIQKDIRLDTTAIGFVYTYGYEGVYEIAWSKRNKKVVVCAASD